jgi:hypothetical protein
VQLRIAVHFVDDWRILTASRFNSLFGGYDLCIHAADVADMVSQVEHAIAKLEFRAGRQRKETPVRVQQIDVVGHGAPGGWIGAPGANEDRITIEHLHQAQHPSTVALKRLSALWSRQNDGMMLRMCETAQGAQGQQFLAELSRTIGANVRGWDGRYEVRPTGKEFTACPDGTITCTDTGLAAFSAIYDRRDFWNNPAWRWYMYNPGYHLWRWAGRFLGAR